MKLFKPFGSKKFKAIFGIQELEHVLLFEGLCLKHTTKNNAPLSINNLWIDGLKPHLEHLNPKRFPKAFNVLIVLNAIELGSIQSEGISNMRIALQGLLNEWLANQNITLPFLPALNVQIDGQRIGDCSLKANEFISLFTPHMIRPDQSQMTHELLVKTSNGTKAKTLGGWYEHQSFLTLGNHWLDTYGIATLPNAAFICLEKKGDRFVLHQNQKYSGLLQIEPDLDSPTPAIHIVESSQKKLFSIELKRIEVQTETPLPSPTPLKVDTINAQTTIWNSGFLLQKIHFPQFMSGYEAYLSKTGELSFSCAAPIATFKVSGKAVLFTPHTLHFRLNGRHIGPHKFVQFTGDQLIQYHQMTFQFIDHRHRKQHKWPYLAEISQLGRKRTLGANKQHMIGRRGSCQIALPSKRQNKNIIWREAYNQQGTIPTKNGMIDKSSFSSDTILVASEHVAIDLSGLPMIQNISRSCQVFLQIGQDFTRLEPKSNRIDCPKHARIFVGNHVFDINWETLSTNENQQLIDKLDPQNDNIH